MKKLSLLTLCLFTFFVSQAQSDSTKKEKKQKSFIVSIRTLDDKMIKGRLYAINDSQLVLGNSAKSFSNTLPTNDQQYIPAGNIKSFSLKRKNSILKGALIGTGAGAVTGIIIGLVSGDDPVYTGSVSDPFTALAVAIGNAFAMTAGEKAALAGVALGVGGAIVGTIIGAVAKKKFIIDGNKEKFRDLRSEIRMKLGQK